MQKLRAVTVKQRKITLLKDKRHMTLRKKYLQLTPQRIIFLCILSALRNLPEKNTNNVIVNMEKGYGQTLHTNIFTHINTDVYNSRQEVKTTVRYLFEPI